MVRTEYKKIIPHIETIISICKTKQQDGANEDVRDMAQDIITEAEYVLSVVRQPESIPGPAPRSDDTDSDMPFIAPKAKILAASGSQALLSSIKGILNRTRARIETATDERGCVRKALLAGYDIILLDDDLTGVIKTIDEFREKGLISSLTKIVMLSNDNRYIQDKTIEMVLDKPVRPAALQETVMDCLPQGKVEKQAISPYPAYFPEWLSNNGFLDINEGLRMCGTPAMYMKTLAAFSAQAEMHISTVRTAVGSKDTDAIEREIRLILETSALIGCRELSGLAEKVLVNKSSPEYLLSLYSAVAGSLSRMKEEDSAPTKESVDPDAIPMILRHLKEYVDDFNDDAVASMLQALSKYQFPNDKSRNILSSLEEAYSRADWIKMQNILENI